MAENDNKNLANDDIASIISSLDLDNLCEKYGVTVPGPGAEMPQDSVTQKSPAASQQDEQQSAGKIKTKLLDFCGLLLLLFSLVIFGVPMIIGKSKRKFSAAVCILLCAVILGSGYGIFAAYQSAKTAAGTPAFLPDQSAAVQPSAITPLVPEAISLLKPDNETAALPDGILDKYKTVCSLNPDVVGWLKIPNTSIDTLVTQGKNNNYYLKNDFYGKFTKYGNAFLDYRNNAKNLSQNSIIYGHTTDTGLQVFYDLYKYMDYNFYINNPVIEFGTLYKDYEWKVFSVYITNVKSVDDNGYFFYYIHPEINESKFTGYLTQIMQRSRFFTDIGVSDSDKILTLSTCVYDNNLPGKPVDSRLVVAARLVREGESREIDPLKVIDNPNYRRPQAWYSHYSLKNPYANAEKWSQ